jgi:hypothetical protein
VAYLGWRSYQLFDVFTNFCRTTVHRTIPSPDGKRHAVVFDIDCGAAGSFNTQVSITPSDQPFSPDESPSSFAVHGQHDLGVRWLNDRALEIHVPPDERIYHQDRLQAGVTITYRRDPPTGN